MIRIEFREEAIEEHPPATVNEATAKIEEITGIRRGPTQVRGFLNSLGLRPRKVGMITDKVDVEEQQRFNKAGGEQYVGHGSL